MEGLIGTGGTDKTVKTIYSGLVISGLKPRHNKSEAGIFSSLDLTSFGVNFLPSSLNVVGLSKVTLTFGSPQ